MVDSFYTPPDLASRLVEYVKNKHFSNVVDFCIGEGELVRAALKIWPEIKCYGTDISEVAIKSVSEKHPDWVLGKCDLLDNESINECNIIKEKHDGFDLILLNPPFSCIGGTIQKVVLDENTFYVSTSMNFLVESIKHLSKNGCLLAIMPISVCYSQKDRKVWEYLEMNYMLSVLEIPNGNYFKNCSPSIVFISINLNHSLNPKTKRFSLKLKNSYSIFRGKVSMYSARQDANGCILIHSTNIRNNELVNLNLKVLNKLSEVTGPAILIPRVGNPSKGKICVKRNFESYTLSDCVIAIKTNNIKTADKIFSLIIDNWDTFSNIYMGTGARFITIERLDFFLGKNKLE